MRRTRFLLVLICLASVAAQAAPTPDERAGDLLAQMTQQEILSLVLGSQAMSRAPGQGFPPGARGSAGYVPGIFRLGIPALQETDAGLGIANPGNVRPGDTATPLPSGLAIAATWDRALAEASGAMVGEEAHRKGFNMLLAGGVNLARDPRNGRNFEYLGEDPLLAGRLDGAFINGVQSRQVMSTIKHFALNDQETQRTTLDVDIDPAAARESDLLAFELAIEDGQPGSVMCAYNLIGGHYACDNDALLNGILKRDWHFPGWVMSDWGAVHGADAAIHGLDQESAAQFDGQAFFGAPLAQAIANGKIPQARLNDMAYRILRSMAATGLLHTLPEPKAIDAVADAALAKRVAEAGIVLLRNQGAVLPLSRRTRSIAIIGGHADRGVLSGGGSSQVIPVGGAALAIPLGGEGGMAGARSILFDPSSPRDAIRAKIPGATVLVDDGRYPAEAQAVARQADIAIVFATQWMMEGYDAPDLSLPDGQDAVIAAVAAANPRTIVVLETGGPVLMPWLSAVPAVIEAWYPGARGADAIADILFGDANPSGRLPISFPASESQLPRPDIPGFGVPEGRRTTIHYTEGADIGYRWYARQSLEPLFPFGFGLSYSRFASANLAWRDGAKPSVTFTLKNTGRREGTATAQIYLTSKAGQKTLRLVGWSRIALRTGESRDMHVPIDPRLLADFDSAADRWHVRGGRYQIAIGNSAKDLGLPADTTLADRILPP